jgi:crotonobetainyl-CoA:carnitine CoA-transferase CaiB-like acyl-CoA transferase
MSARSRLLDGIQVAELGLGVAGRYAGSMLKALGATVTRLDLRDSPFEDGDRYYPDPQLAARLDFGKVVARISDIPSALAERPVDVVLADRIQYPIPGLPSSPSSYTGFVRDLNSSVWVTISAFGLDGPKRDLTASDFTLLAVGGQLNYVRSMSENSVVPLPLWHGMQTAGQAAVLAACYGLDQLHSGRQATHLDLSAQEALIAAGPFLQCGYLLLGCGDRIKAARLAVPYGLYPCIDGAVSITVLEDHQWKAVAGVIDAPLELVGLALPDRLSIRAQIDGLVRAWTSIRARHECERILQAHGVAAVAVNSLSDALHSESFRSRASVDIRDTSGHRPWVAANAIACREDVPGDHAPHSVSSGGRRSAGKTFSEIDILELGHVLAVPYATAILGAMGARVTKVESSSRPDAYRRTGPFIDANRDPEWSAYFALCNHTKSRNVFMDLDAESTAIASLLASADVVIENWGLSRAGRLPVNMGSLAKRHPHKLTISSSGFGHSGPISGYRAYANEISAYSGLTAYLRDKYDESGVEVAFPLADMLTAFFLASVIASWIVGPQDSAAFDISMSEVLAAHLSLSGEEAHLPDADPDRNGNSEIRVVIEGTDDAACAVSVRNLAHWQTVRSICHDAGIETPETAMPDLVRLQAALSHDDLAPLVRRLQASGIQASPVLKASDLIADSHLASRMFFAEVDHPLWGSRRLIGLPWRIAGEAPIPLRAPVLSFP